VKYRHLIANLAKPTLSDRSKLAAKEADLLRMRANHDMKRDVTVSLILISRFCINNSGGTLLICGKNPSSSISGNG